jgi:hypothetical protein
MPGCECCFSLNSLVDAGSLVGLRVTVCTSVTQNSVHSALGLLQDIPKNCPIAVILDFSFPYIFVHAHTHVLGMISKKILKRHCSLSTEFLIHVFTFSLRWTSVQVIRTCFKKFAMSADKWSYRYVPQSIKRIERCQQNREDYTKQAAFFACVGSTRHLHRCIYPTVLHKKVPQLARAGNNVRWHWNMPGAGCASNIGVSQCQRVKSTK